MAGIEYVTALRKKYQSKGFQAYRWSVYETAPFVPFTKPLNRSTVGLVSSGGISEMGQEPFDGWAVNDFSYRLVPVDTPFDRLKLDHNYFDHRDAAKDYNCVLPIQRFQELVEEGFIGNVPRSAVSLGMGRTYKRSGLFQHTIPAIVSELQERRVDASLLVAA